MDLMDLAYIHMHVFKMNNLSHIVRPYLKGKRVDLMAKTNVMALNESSSALFTKYLRTKSILKFPLEVNTGPNALVEFTPKSKILLQRRIWLEI